MNISDYTEEAVILLKEIIKIPAKSRDEKKRADFIEDWLKSKNININRIKNNLWAISPGFTKSKPTILLNAHIDTVKPNNGWENDPYIPIEKNGCITGLGANDDGASVVCMIQTFRILCQKEQHYNFILSLSAEEEVTGINGIDILLENLPHIDLGIVGEPTGMNPAIAEKGLVVFDCTVSGKAGHAARHEGINAIYKALPIIEWFKDRQFEEISKFLGPVMMSVTQINAGTQHNVIPDKCTFVVDCRINEFFSPESITNKISEEVKCEIKPRSFRLNSSKINIDHPAVTACIKNGGKPFGSPTLSNQTRMYFDTLKIGPGESSRSHTANEFIKIEEIKDGIEKYIKILDGLKI